MMRFLSRNVPCRSLGCHLAWQQPSRWGHVAASILTAAFKTRSYTQMVEKTALRMETLGSEEAGQRLDKVLARLLPGVPHTRLVRLLRKGGVRLNGKGGAGGGGGGGGGALRVRPVRVPAPEAQDAPAAPSKAAVRLGEQLGRAIIHQDDRLLV